jgi:hypothetical protein
MQVELLKAITEHSLSGLGGLSLSPKRNTYPIAQLGPLVLFFDYESNSTAESAFAAPRDGEAETVCAVRQEVSCILLGIRVRDAQSGRCHLAGADQPGEFWHIGLLVSAQPEPGSFNLRQRRH